MALVYEGHFISSRRYVEDAPLLPPSRSQREHFTIATQSFQESTGFISRPKVISLRICDAPLLPCRRRESWYTTSSASFLGTFPKGEGSGGARSRLRARSPRGKTILNRFLTPSVSLRYLPYHALFLILHSAFCILHLRLWRTSFAFCTLHL